MTLVARNLGFAHHRSPVLTDVSIGLERGRVAVVLGSNGAGKTTLLRLLAGLLVPGSGDVLLGDVPLARIDRRERARRIGYLPQGGNDQWSLRTEEVVALGRLPHRSPFAAPTARDADAIERAMARTDTTHFRGRSITALSGGERARVHLARALATEPEWLLADEPLADLDPPQQARVLGLLSEAARAGCGVVAVLHDLNAAARIADTVTLLRDGRLVAHGATADVLTSANLGLAYRAAFDVERRADGRLLIWPQASIVRAA